MQNVLSLSVHALVDFLLRVGDIDSRIYNKSTMAEGSRLHASYQTKQGSTYIAEYAFKEYFVVDEFRVSLEGRADGLIIGDHSCTIDEIKTTVTDLKDYYAEQGEWHLGQAKCYALMLAHERKLDSVDVRLIYINQLDGERMVKTFSFSLESLEEDVIGYIKQYLNFYRFINERIIKRNESAKTLEFPFKSFRDGQRQLAKYTYGVAKDGGILFCEAPTGIGKTMSTLYPSIKSFALGKNDKVFYLTAKNSGKESASNAIAKLKDAGLIASEIVLTAKDKICFCPGKACNPDECPFAKGYYTKIKNILIETLINEQSLNYETITRIAKQYAICPFEFSLDLSLFVDIIICDYNYFFDPMVYLKRFFDEDASRNFVLVDEAHNLVERGRAMYSASISYLNYKLAKRNVKYLEHRAFKNAKSKLTKVFRSLKNFKVGETIIEKLDDDALKAMDAFLLAASDVNKKHHDIVKQEFVDFFFELNRFRKLYDYFDESFLLYVKRIDNKDVHISLLCLDPSKQLSTSLKKVGGKVLFSATLSPVEYYIKMLGGKDDDPVLMLPSPFEKDNLCLLIAPKVSTKYKDREETYVRVASLLKAMVDAKMGNYCLYFPSYKYLENIAPYLEFENADVFAQSKDMTDLEKEAFVSLFKEKPTKTVVGLAIVGGTFSEGIDLVSDRLIGVGVVGVGLPQICFERKAIKNYFDKLDGCGYLNAYQNPGMNKVMQAVGRLIRSENDRGVALLIDDRYLSASYRSMYKREWDQYKVVMSKEDIEKELTNFYAKKK